MEGSFLGWDLRLGKACVSKISGPDGLSCEGSVILAGSLVYAAKVDPVKGDLCTCSCRQPSYSLGHYQKLDGPTQLTLWKLVCLPQRETLATHRNTVQSTALSQGGLTATWRSLPPRVQVL